MEPMSSGPCLPVSALWQMGLGEGPPAVLTACSPPSRPLGPQTVVCKGPRKWGETVGREAGVLILNQPWIS